MHRKQQIRDPIQSKKYFTPIIEYPTTVKTLPIFVSNQYQEAISAYQNSFKNKDYMQLSVSSQSQGTCAKQKLSQFQEQTMDLQMESKSSKFISKKVEAFVQNETSQSLKSPQNQQLIEQQHGLNPQKKDQIRYSNNANRNINRQYINTMKQHGADICLPIVKVTTKAFVLLYHDEYLAKEKNFERVDFITNKIKAKFSNMMSEKQKSLVQLECPEERKKLDCYIECLRLLIFAFELFCDYPVEFQQPLKILYRSSNTKKSKQAIRSFQKQREQRQ